MNCVKSDLTSLLGAYQYGSKIVWYPNDCFIGENLTRINLEAIEVLAACQLRSLILLAFIMLAAAGCSGVSFVYGLAEIAVAREAEFHLDLDEDGDALVDEKVDALLDWHSKDMLPRYARFMNAQADVIDLAALSHTEVDRAVVEMRKLLEALVAGASRYSADVLVEHTEPEKIRFIKARMAERLAERWEEQEEPPEERLEARVEGITDSFERFTGSLSDSQKGAIQNYAEATLVGTEVWLRNRENRQRAFTEFLAQAPDKKQIEAFVYKIILRPHEIVDPEYRAISEARWKRFQALLYGIMTTLSPEQRQMTSETLRRYAAEMLELAS